MYEAVNGWSYIIIWKNNNVIISLRNSNVNLDIQQRRNYQLRLEIDKNER
jgi:hypothetical protein